MHPGVNQHFMPVRVLCHVRRDMADIAATVVFAHEIPILKAIHGDSAITLVDAKAAEVEMEQPKEPLDLVSEYGRLVEKFGMHEKVEVPNVEYVYGRIEEGRFAKALATKPLKEVP